MPSPKRPRSSAQYYVNSRWLGGTLTNWKTISGSISRLRKLDEMLVVERGAGLHQEGAPDLQRERDKLDRSLGGIKDMGGLPDLLFVIDTNKEDIAIKEAQRLNIPVAAIVDTNCDPDGITYVGAGQRRRQPRHHALLRPDRARGDRRHLARAGSRWALTSVPRTSRLPRSLPAEPAADSAGYEVLSGPRGVADDLKKLGHVSPAIEKKLNDLGIFHYWQIAGLGPDGRACDRRGSRAAGPRRRLDCPGQGTDGRMT